jgi:hypothetical protein
MSNEYQVLILSPNVYLLKNIESTLGKIYFEKINNNNTKANKTKIIWCAKKKGTNWGIYINLLYIQIT